ncbi:peptidase M16 [Noviherbaspirillum aridicola]|uniref:Peptidase M16 n=2 Tax=Noviherbaspirillum aridicola TaxID=2849687 RepID=A0ABQ4Q6T0_9BURK|nr:peptidase M16 [Noviherbaspirillum aridicola]
MQAEVQEFEDPASGARHIHLANSDKEYVFLVAFPTVPDASDGRAHILEHLALCGSRRYPVRDPFFAMSRRSIAHFMNAMTYADKTVYPFASTDRTDFFNLLHVYLDAAFFPRLDYLDFLQEGWRLVLEGDQLSYQGIVFNEMKGAFADPVRALDAGIAAELLAGTTYAHESGGDPLHIPSLTHEALREFHRTHYHPSQAVFMTAGAIDPTEIQQVIDEHVLSQMHGKLPRLLPELAGQWPAPKSTRISIPGRDHGMQFAWLLGQSVDVNAHYEAILLDTGLLGNAAAPLANAMESAGFGRPSAMNGVDTGMRQLVFHLGMEGLQEDQVAQAREQIWRALERAAEEGVPRSVLEAGLRDHRFRQREIAAGSLPNSMRRLLRAIPYEMYGGDVMLGFDNEDVLRDLQQKIADPAWFKTLVRGLLDNPTRLDAEVLPDPDYFDKREQAERAQLEQRRTALTESEKQRLQREAEQLVERQRAPVNNDVLPRILPQDLDPTPHPVEAVRKDASGAAPIVIASNAVSYARVLYDLSDLPEQDWPWLQLYAEIVTELGVGSRTYLEADAWRHDKVPYFDMNVHVMQTQGDSRGLRIIADFYAKGLSEENAAIAEVLKDSVQGARFDELDRIAYLIDSNMQDLRDDLAENGDDYAKLAATAPLSPLRRYEQMVRGSAWLEFFHRLHGQSRDDQGLRRIAEKLAAMHRRITSAPGTVLAAGAEHDVRKLIEGVSLPSGTAPSQPSCGAPAAAPLANLALHAPAQVNHCFAAWPGPTLSHPDAPVLAVLGELMTNLVLHQSLREEGGAYGGHAAYSTDSNLFVMMSYRDPRLEETYEVFQDAIEWVLDSDIAREKVEEAIICVMQSLDRPRTPFEAVMWAWEQQERGITDEIRRSYRTGVLECTTERLKQAAADWLKDKPFSRAAFVGRSEQALAGLELLRLAELAG